VGLAFERPAKPRVMAENHKQKPPLQSRSRETVKTILEAATRVLGKEGLARTTTNRIAEVAGVSVGSLYQFFRNKDSILAELFTSTLEANLTELLETLGKNKTAEVRPFFIALVDALAENFEKRRPVAQALVEYFTGRVGLRGLHQMDARMTPVLLDYLRESGMLIRTENAESAIFVLLQAIRTTIFMAYTGDKAPEEITRIKSELVELCVRYLEH
jgi:AcrR family transcriptional regulator